MIRAATQENRRIRLLLGSDGCILVFILTAAIIGATVLANPYFHKRSRALGDWAVHDIAPSERAP